MAAVQATGPAAEARLVPVWDPFVRLFHWSLVAFFAGAWLTGEEIGWRGFFIWELRKVVPFSGVALISGIVWSAWHYPIVIKYGFGDPLFQIGCFTLMITSMSVIMAYYAFRSNSLWPAVFFHGAHNIYIQKIFSPLTTPNEQTRFWIDEYGLILPVIVTLIAIYYWRRAKAEGM